MDVRLLPALRAIRTGQWRGAVKAIPLMRSAIRIGFAGAGFDGARKHPSGYCGAKRVKFAHQLPLGSNIRPADWRVLAARSMARIGLLGGSFNPAHRGHRRISLEAMRVLGLDEVWWLVSPGNPLKEGASDMAPLAARYASAKAMARRSRIVPTAIEAELGTRFTADTLRQLKRRFPNRQFIWLMGADNLAQFHLWRDWRTIARLMPIAVIRRPGYDRTAHAARAMGWLRGFVRPSSQARNWTDWSAPAILLLRLPPDPSSATRLRAHDPNWHERFTDPEGGSKRFGLPTSVRRALARPTH